MSWPRRWSFEGYGSRILLLRTPWDGAVYLHHFVGPDPSGILHTHPFGLFSLVLWGSYTESREGTLRHRRWWNWIPKGGAHRIDATRGVWTLAITGRADFSAWGYLDPAGEWHPMPGTQERMRQALLLD